MSIDCRSHSHVRLKNGGEGKMTQDFSTLENDQISSIKQHENCSVKNRWLMPGRVQVCMYVVLIYFIALFIIPNRKISPSSSTTFSYPLCTSQDSWKYENQIERVQPCLNRIKRGTRTVECTRHMRWIQDTLIERDRMKWQRLFRWRQGMETPLVLPPPCHPVPKQPLTIQRPPQCPRW